MRLMQLFIKRAFDIVLSCALLIILIPFFILVILMRKFEGEPVWYSQERVGRYGSMFAVHKISTADPTSKRPLWLCGWMRHYGVDELPQLWNILCGDMSFIGPRPITLEDEFNRYQEHPSWRRCMRPGLLSLYTLTVPRVSAAIVRPNGHKLQVDYRAIELDRGYITNWSLVSDLRVIWFACRVLRTWMKKHHL